MVTVDIDPSLYDDIKVIVKQNKIRYPSVKFFVQRHLVDGVETLRNSRQRNLQALAWQGKSRISGVLKNAPDFSPDVLDKARCSEVKVVDDNKKLIEKGIRR